MQEQSFWRSTPDCERAGEAYLVLSIFINTRTLSITSQLTIVPIHRIFCHTLVPGLSCKDSTRMEANDLSLLWVTLIGELLQQ